VIHVHVKHLQPVYSSALVIRSWVTAIEDIQVEALLQIATVRLHHLVTEE